MTGGARRSAGSGETRRKSVEKKKSPLFFLTGGPFQIVLGSGTPERSRKCAPPLLLVSRQRTLLRGPTCITSRR